ncbi:hypothetical protein ACLTEW_11425 [Gordonia lacunae]|uniref:hypothetical protein n=1 Tax=Gordonia lacunae TaxID=417102 RepID=UPI0039E4EC66
MTTHHDTPEAPMPFYVLSPEVPANAMDEVFADDPRVPRRTVAARMEFEYPLRSEIIASLRTYAVTEELAEAMNEAGLTGYRLGPCTTSIAPWVEDPDAIGELPPLLCLDIWGIPLEHDLALRAKDGQIIVSQRAYDLICSRDPSLIKSSDQVDEHGNTIYKV